MKHVIPGDEPQYYRGRTRNCSHPLQNDCDLTRCGPSAVHRDTESDPPVASLTQHHLRSAAAGQLQRIIDGLLVASAAGTGGHGTSIGRIDFCWGGEGRVTLRSSGHANDCAAQQVCHQSGAETLGATSPLNGSDRPRPSVWPGLPDTGDGLRRRRCHLRGAQLRCGL
jgi:hypothetical protein